MLCNKSRVIIYTDTIRARHYSYTDLNCRLITFLVKKTERCVTDDMSWCESQVSVRDALCGYVYVRCKVIACCLDLLLFVSKIKLTQNRCNNFSTKTVRV